MRVIGLISGTSVDGIDAALVEISGSTMDLQVELLTGQTIPYPSALRQQILAVCSGAPLSVAELAELDDAIAEQFANAAIALQKPYAPAQLIGSHGQTVFHRPKQAFKEQGKGNGSNQRPAVGYSLQLGRGALIAHLTGIPTVSNFRAADIAANGQGAPLVSKVDACLLGHPHKTSCIQNIGGIGNVTYLPAQTGDRWQDQVLGWDTGPGNSLLDLAVQHLSHGEKSYDENGSWAATGTPAATLVHQWLQHPFFQQAPPKSTGRELFGVEYLHQCLQDCEAWRVTQPADILATLTELTAASIAHSYQTFLPQMPERIFLCGGGSKNQYLNQRLQHHLQPTPVLTTDEIGLNADFKEAIAFAVLAYWRTCNIPGNLPSVTGASQDMLLGEIFSPVS